jgi:hypothetical protein
LNDGEHDADFLVGAILNAACDGFLLRSWNTSNRAASGLAARPHLAQPAATGQNQPHET